jgi:glycosyltransferase involved in cell wall biosynthesis
MIENISILYVNKNDLRGGAARNTALLRAAMEARGHSAFLAVARKESNDDTVLQIPALPPHNNPMSEIFWRVYQRMLNEDAKGARHFLRRLMLIFADPFSIMARFLGHEVFRYPGSHQVLGLSPVKPEIVHLNNLHSSYFDLRFLPKLSNQLPVFITLHDEWLLTGHCAGTFGCERWKIGCGSCPDLISNPSIFLDGTRFNWCRKKQIYANSRLYVAAPSKWLMEKARQSILSTAIIESRVIPNGVNQTIFKPANKDFVRIELGLDPSAKVALIQAAPNFRTNRFKDYETIRQCVSILLGSQRDDIQIVAVGPLQEEIEFQSKNVKIFPYANSQETLAKLYQAADVFLHAAHSDNFPTVILESLSCGTPVVASAVGGIPEQVRHGENGFLVKRNDAADMARKTLAIFDDPLLQKRLSEGALSSARPFFSLEQMVDKYESWYSEVLEVNKRKYLEK